MDWYQSLLSIGVGAAIGTVWAFLLRWIKKPKPINKHEMPRLRAQVLKAIHDRYTDGDFKRDMEIAWVEREKRVEYLRLYAQFSDRYELPDILNTVMVLQRTASHSKGKHPGYTQYRTQVELTADHIELYAAFNNSMKDAPDDPATKEELWALWEKERDMIAYAFSRPADEAHKMLDIIRDRRIYDLEPIKSILAVMDTPGSGAVSSGAL